MLLPTALATQARLTARLERLHGVAPSVAVVGVDDPPPDAVVHEDVRVVGSGAAAFAALGDALLAWDVHRGAGMAVVASGPVAVGATVVNAAPFGPLLRVLVPCRVVAMVEGDRRRGFVYATLPGNPVAGVERFTAALASDGAVSLAIRSWSRPAGMARLAPLVLRLGQAAGNRRYLDAAAELLRDRP